MTTSAVSVAARPAGAGLRRFMMLLQANLMMFLRERVALFWVVIFPISLMLLFGAIWGNQALNSDDPNSPTFISYLAPGLIVLSLMSSGIVGNSSVMASWRERGVLRRVQGTPLPVWQLILARTIVQAFVMVGQAYLMIAVAVLAFGARFEAGGLLVLLPLALFGAVVFMSIGQALAAIARKANTVNVIGQVINLPLMFLGGLWMPISQLPTWLADIARWLPSTMMADLVRAPLINAHYFQPTVDTATALIGLTLVFAVATLIAVRFFKWS